MRRTIEGPDESLLSIRDVAKYLRLKVRTVRRLIETGEFFEPVEISPGTKVWTAEDVAVYLAWRERRPRLRAAPPPEKPPPAKGHRGANQRTSGDNRGQPADESA